MSRIGTLRVKSHNFSVQHNLQTPPGTTIDNGHYIPCYWRSFTFIFEFPDIFRQFRAINIFFVSKISRMVIIAVFERYTEICKVRIWDDWMSDTRPVSRLYDFQMWLQCWRYHYYLLIWCCLSNYDVRYVYAFIKSHRSGVFFSVNAVEATFAVIYMLFTWLFSVG